MQQSFWGELRSFLATSTAAPHKKNQADFNLVVFRNWLRELRREDKLLDLPEYLAQVVPYLWEVWKDCTPIGEDRLLVGGEESHLIPYVLPFMKQLNLHNFAQDALSQAPLQKVLLSHPLLRSLPKLESVHFPIPVTMPGGLPEDFLNEWLVQSSPVKRSAEVTLKNVYFPTPEIVKHFSVVKLTHYASAHESPYLDLSQLKHLKLIKVRTEPYAQGAFNALIANYLAAAPQVESLAMVAPARDRISDWGRDAAALARTLPLGKTHLLKHFSLAFGDDGTLFTYDENGTPKTLAAILEDCAQWINSRYSPITVLEYTTGLAR